MMSGLHPTRSLAWPCGWEEHPQVAERGLVLRVRRVQGRAELGQELYAAVRTRGQGGRKGRARKGGSQPGGAGVAVHPSAYPWLTTTRGPGQIGPPHLCAGPNLAAVSEQLDDVACRGSRGRGPNPSKKGPRQACAAWKRQNLPGKTVGRFHPPLPTPPPLRTPRQNPEGRRSADGATGGAGWRGPGPGLGRVRAPRSHRPRGRPGAGTQWSRGTGPGCRRTCW